MKKLFSVTLIIALFLFFTQPSQAQVMMGKLQSPTPTDSTSTTAQDEADGKVIWDKLQSKQATCQSLTDDDFDVLGDYAMGLMVGNSHEAMNNNMTQMMGADREKQMHIAIGKQYSGCVTQTGTSAAQSANLQWGPGSMMGRGGSYVSAPLGLHIIGLLTWLLGVAFLTSGTVFFYKEIKKKQK